MIPRQVQQLKWTKHPRGYIKINFDAVWNNNKAGMGFIACDMEGFVHGGGALFNPDVVSTD